MKIDMEKEQINDFIITNLPVGFSIVDKDGITIDFNTAAEKITGYEKYEVIGKSHFEILHSPTDRDKCPLLKHALIKHEQSVASESVIKKKNGELITISVTTFPLYDNKGNFIGGVKIFRDISASKKLERERKNILSMFAHDMRNPIITSGGFLSRLLLGKAGLLTEKQQKYLELIREELTDLEGLVTNFLEFSRFEAKEYKPIPILFNIEMAIEKQIAASKMEAEDRKSVV